MITNANPGVVTASAAHGYNAGDQVDIAGTGTPLDSTPGRQYLVCNPATYTFTLTDLDGNAIDTTSYGAYGGSGGTVARVFTLTTPYSGNDVQLIKWTQSADTLTLCHPNYPPQDLTSTQHWAWNLTQIALLLPFHRRRALRQTTGEATAGGTIRYVVTAITDGPPDESLPSPLAGCLGSS